MYASKDLERLYLRSWDYNAAKVLTKLAQIVEKKGGRVKFGNRALISNRSITENIVNKQCRNEQLYGIISVSDDTEKNAIRYNAIASNKKEIEELKSYDNKPIIATHLTYIRFIYENQMYCYNLDDNPFYPFHYSKTPVRSNQYSLDACMDEDKKEWLYDCFFHYDCTDEDVEKAASFIFDMLIYAKDSYIRVDSKKQRVSNIYDNGWHWEYVREKERMAKVDF